MTEKVNHSALTTHSAPFSVAGGVYNVSAAGTIAHGTDPIELQRLVNGGWASMDPPVRFLNGESGGTKQTVKIPASTLRWFVPGNNLHSINTAVVGQ